MRGGNNHGLPVTYVGVSIVPQDYFQPYVNEFIDEFGINVCANDYNSDPLLGQVHTNAVHDSFQLPFVKPVFLVINCVSNSPSHQAGQLLLTVAGDQGSAGWSILIFDIRAAIDLVQAPAPGLTNARISNNRFQFTFPCQIGRTNVVEATTDLRSPVSWTPVGSFAGTNGPITFRDANSGPNPRRFYRVRRL